MKYGMGSVTQSEIFATIAMTAFVNIGQATIVIFARTGTRIAMLMPVDMIVITI